MAKLRPLPGFVLIQPMDEQETTASGLVMPEKAKEKPGKGKVLELSPIVPREARDFAILGNEPHISWTSELNKIKKGSIVIYHKWSGNEIRDGQRNYVLVKFADLQGVYV